MPRWAVTISTELPPVQRRRSAVLPTRTRPTSHTRSSGGRPDRSVMPRRSDIERARDFEHRFAKAQATDVIELGWGYAVLQADFPLSEYHNRVAVTAAAPAVDIVGSTDDIFEGAGLRHRYISVDEGLGKWLTYEFVAAGYDHETIVTMIYRGDEPDAPEHPVLAVTDEELRPAIIRDWRVTIPGATDEHLAQLADRQTLYTRGADVKRLVVYDGAEIAASAHLYVDRIDNVVQFENLVTHADYQGRGYAGALIREALRLGRDADAELSVLTTDHESWTREWYERIGYVEAGRTHHFSRRS